MKTLLFAVALVFLSVGVLAISSLKAADHMPEDVQAMFKEIKKDLTEIRAELKEIKSRQKTILSILNPDKYDGSYQVIRVIDGDTIVLKYQDAELKVRLLRINVPDANDYAQKNGRDAMKSLIEGKEVSLKFEKEGEPGKDIYGRLLAYVFLGGINVNIEMVRLGWSTYWTKYGTSRFEGAFTRAQDEAMRQKRGIWGQKVEPKVEPKEKTQKDPDEDVTVYITRTGSKYHRGSCSYLRKSRIPISLKEAKRRGYTPCSRCNPPG